jgi:lipopolysaccharide transport LptD-like protein
MHTTVVRLTRFAIVAAALMLLCGDAVAQSSATVPLPGAASGNIVWSSRVIQHWYERDKLHTFLMIDGLKVTQGQWTLTARDGVVWLDESQLGASGEVTLGIYAEESVVVKGPGIEKPLTFDRLYITLRTTGDVERRSAPGQDTEKKGAGTPLYLRARRIRSDALTRPAKVAPETPPKTAADVTKLPEGKAVTEAETEVAQDIVVRPLHGVGVVPGARTVLLPDPELKGRQVAIYTGGVVVMAGDIEMKAGNVVIWTNNSERSKEINPETGKVRGPEAEIYLEGNVVFNESTRTVRASKVYYDIATNRAMILDAAVRSFSRARGVPVYYYAKEARQLARGKFVAEKAAFTTSEMGIPHTAIEGKHFEFTDLSEEDPDGTKHRRIRYRADNVVSRIRNVPVTWWPRMAGDIEQGETALRRVQLSERSNRGTGIESQWHLWKLLGLYRAPSGFKKTYLNLNFFSERGPVIETESRYLRDDFYGNWLATFVHDQGKDNIGGDSVKPPREPRGRVRWRHRQFLPRDWQLTLETSYLSDAQYLAEWYEREFKEGKDQETLVHLKKQWDRNTLSILMKGRINDFQTETEVFPRVEYHLLGQPLWEDRLTYNTTSVLEYAQFSPDDRLAAPRSSPWTTIVDTDHEVAMPIQLGFVKVLPFVDGRATYFEHQVRGRGDDVRTYIASGLRASWYLSKVYDDVHSQLWNLNRLRHVNTFDIEAMVAQTDVPSRRLHAFDEPGSAETKLVRGVDKTDVYRLGWRQRWQTHRGPEQKNVDWITFDMLMTWFGDTDTPRVSPDDDRAHNNLTVDYAWQLSDTTSLVGDVYYTTNDGEIRIANVGLSVIRSPRFSYYIGNRYIRGADSSLLTLGLDYVINRKWSIHAFEQIDLDQDFDNTSTRLELVRRLANWYMTVSFEFDNGEDDKIFSVQFQPVGVPELRLRN